MIAYIVIMSQFSNAIIAKKKNSSILIVAMLQDSYPDCEQVAPLIEMILASWTFI